MIEWMDMFRIVVLVLVLSVVLTLAVSGVIAYHWDRRDQHQQAALSYHGEQRLQGQRHEREMVNLRAAAERSLHSNPQPEK